MNAKKTAPETRDPGSQGGLAGGTVNMAASTWR